MISATKGSLSLNNHKILRPKGTKNLTNLHKKFCEFPPSVLIIMNAVQTASSTPFLYESLLSA